MVPVHQKREGDESNRGRARITFFSEVATHSEKEEEEELDQQKYFYFDLGGRRHSSRDK